MKQKKNLRDRALLGASSNKSAELLIQRRKGNWEKVLGGSVAVEFVFNTDDKQKSL